MWNFEYVFTIKIYIITIKTHNSTTNILKIINKEIDIRLKIGVQHHHGSPTWFPVSSIALPKMLYSYTPLLT